MTFNSRTIPSIQQQSHSNSISTSTTSTSSSSSFNSRVSPTSTLNNNSNQRTSRSNSTSQSPTNSLKQFYQNPNFHSSNSTERDDNNNQRSAQLNSNNSNQRPNQLESSTGQLIKKNFNQNQTNSNNNNNNNDWNGRMEEDDGDDLEQEDDEMDLDEDGDGDSGGNNSGSKSDSAAAKAARDRKRSRTLTTSHQTSVLTALLSKTRFPSTETREEVGKQIGMSSRRVQIWFQNRRQSQKRVKDRDGNEIVPSSSFPGYQYQHQQQQQQQQQHQHNIGGRELYSSSSAEPYPSVSNNSRFQPRPLVVHHHSYDNSSRSQQQQPQQSYPGYTIGSTEEAHSRRLISSSSGIGTGHFSNSLSSSTSGRKEYDYSEYEERLAASASSRWQGGSLPQYNNNNNSTSTTNSSAGSSTHSKHQRNDNPSHYHSRSPSLHSPTILPPVVNYSDIRSNNNHNYNNSPSPPSTGVSTSSTNTTSSSTSSSFTRGEYVGLGVVGIVGEIKLPPISSMFLNGPTSPPSTASSSTSAHRSPLSLPIPLPSSNGNYSQYRQTNQDLDSPSGISFTSDRTSTHRSVLSSDLNRNHQYQFGTVNTLDTRTGGESQGEEENPFDLLSSSIHQQKRHDSTTTIMPNQTSPKVNEVEGERRLSSRNGSESNTGGSRSNSVELLEEDSASYTSTSSSNYRPRSSASNSSRSNFNSRLEESSTSSLNSTELAPILPLSLSITTTGERLPKLSSLAIYSPTEERFSSNSNSQLPSLNRIGLTSTQNDSPSTPFDNRSYFDSPTSTITPSSATSTVGSISTATTTSSLSSKIIHQRTSPIISLIPISDVRSSIDSVIPSPASSLFNGSSTTCSTINSSTNSSLINLSSSSNRSSIATSITSIGSQFSTSSSLKEEESSDQTVESSNIV